MYGVLLNLSLFQGWFEGCSVVSCWVYGIHQKSGMIENSGPFCGWSFGGGWLLALPHCFTRWFPINRASWSAARLVARCKRPEFSHGKDLLWNGFKRCVGDHVHHINSEESMFGVKSLSYILEDHKKSIQKFKARFILGALWLVVWNMAFIFPFSWE